MSNLGETYRLLKTGDPIANLHRAIEYQEAALRVISQASAPLHWARIQNNLGAAWSTLPVANGGATMSFWTKLFGPKAAPEVDVAEGGSPAEIVEREGLGAQIGRAHV